MTHKTFRVQMLAFADPGTVREVEVPVEKVSEKIHSLLDAIYYYGQNDFQPKNCPSLSVADVIEVDDDKYLICSFGFRKLNEQEYQELLSFNQRDRQFCDLTLNDNVK